MYDFAVCGCLEQKLSVKEAWLYLLEEAVELGEFTSMANLVEELSDIAFAVGRLLGAVRGECFVYVPGAGPSCRKFAARVEKRGCSRSTRHLVNGECPAKAGAGR